MLGVNFFIAQHCLLIDQTNTNMRASRSPCRWHVKALVVDGRVSFTGGANLTANSQVNEELVQHRIDVAAVAATERAIRAFRGQICPDAVMLSRQNLGG